MWRKDFLLHRPYLQKTLWILTCFSLALLHSASYFFFLYQSPSSFCTVFDTILSNTDKVLLIKPSANLFFFWDCNVHCKDWLTNSGGTVRPSELWLTHKWLSMLMEFQVRYSAFFLFFSVIDSFGWFWREILPKNIQLMLEFFKAPFLFLHFSFNTSVIFLMMLSVILQYMLIYYYLL